MKYSVKTNRPSGFYRGDETGALYIRMLGYETMICVVPSGGVALGETVSSKAGRFTAVPADSTITVET